LRMSITGSSLRVGCLLLVFLASAGAMSAGTHNPFIYFRF
jgi:hypothetical protein